MSTVAVLFGRRGSSLAGKNTRRVLGRPVCVYPLSAASGVAGIDALYVSTNDTTVASLARSVGAEWIERPEELCTPEARLEDAVAHAYRFVGRLRGARPEVVVVLLANAPCITPQAIGECLAALEADPTLDSAVTVSDMTGFGPYRARKIEGGLVVPAIPAPEELTGNRQSTGSIVFTDQGCTAVRGRVLEDVASQPGPFKWQGARIAPVYQTPGGGDVDDLWQYAAAEWWLREHGYSEPKTAG